ncbi:MAG: RHS repeat-associated core domain-containing protein [Opitutaceae bacterium]
MDSVSSGYYERSTYWQSFRRLEDAVETTWNGSLRASYLYGYDLEGRRLAENVTGPITTKWDAGWTHGFQMSWSYTGRGNRPDQDSAAGRFRPADRIVGQLLERDWNWDDVSNRTFEDHVDDQQDRTYSANSLNQYNWYEEDEHQYNFNHDDDGNLTDDGTWSYTYDLEDRVIGMSKTGITLSFTYDYLGRRVRKVASGGDFPGTYEYVYDGFNAIAVYRNDARMGSYTWGLDKTGTLHGAGGVGGLLMVRGTNPSFPLMDARGNVTGLLDGSGNIYRAYQFDAFGNAVGYKLNTGVQSMDFIGFASNFTDIESGLVDFGMRLYQPKHGRFIHRDPIGESGGENLYAHTWNDPVNRWDLLGMIPDLQPIEENSLSAEHERLLWDTFTFGQEDHRDNFIWIDGASISYSTMSVRGAQAWQNVDGFRKEVMIDDKIGKIVNGWGETVGVIVKEGPSLAQSGQGGEYSHTQSDGTVVVTPFVVTAATGSDDRVYEAGVGVGAIGIWVLRDPRVGGPVLVVGSAVVAGMVSGIAINEINNRLTSPNSIRSIANGPMGSLNRVEAVTSDVNGALDRIARRTGIPRGELGKRFHRIKGNPVNPTNAPRGQNRIDDRNGDVINGDGEVIGNVITGDM